MIHYLLHNEIDKNRWDRCIENSVHPLPYALSWWLDVVSPGWEALVMDDYVAVMPLTGRKKFGFNYLYQPFFTQQLGIFAANHSEVPETGLFLRAIPSKYRYIDIQLNAANVVIAADFGVKPRADFILHTGKSYIQIESNYHRNCRRNIQKALHEGLKVKPGPGPVVFSRFVEQNLDRKLAVRLSGMYLLLPEIIQASVQHKCGEILGVCDRNGKINAAGWFVHIFGRCLFIVCASTSEGKKKQAMYLLVDHMIREKAGSNVIFDFTGSEIPGVAYFNAGFGAEKQVYPAIRKNDLPGIVKMFKK